MPLYVSFFAFFCSLSLWTEYVVIFILVYAYEASGHALLRPPMPYPKRIQLVEIVSKYFGGNNEQ